MNDLIEKARTTLLLEKLMAAVERGELPEPRHLTDGEDLSSRTPFNRRDTLVARRAVVRVTTSVLAIQALAPGPEAHRYLTGRQLQQWRHLIQAPRAWLLPPPGSSVEVVVGCEGAGFIHHEGVVLSRTERRITVSSPTGGDWYIPHHSPVPVSARDSGVVGYSWRPL